MKNERYQGHDLPALTGIDGYSTWDKLLDMQLRKAIIPITLGGAKEAQGFHINIFVNYTYRLYLKVVTPQI